MQLINDFEKIMVKSPGRELSSVFGTSKDGGGGTLGLKYGRAGSIVWGLGLRLGKRYFGVLQQY